MEIDESDQFSIEMKNGIINLNELKDFWLSYEGQFENGEFNGFGILRISAEFKITGQFENSIAQGKGTVYLPNGSTKEGIWKDNIFELN